MMTLDLDDDLPPEKAPFTEFVAWLAERLGRRPSLLEIAEARAEVLALHRRRRAAARRRRDRQREQDRPRHREPDEPGRVVAFLSVAWWLISGTLVSVWLRPRVSAPVQTEAVQAPAQAAPARAAGSVLVLPGETPEAARLACRDPREAAIRREMLAGWKQFPGEADAAAIARQRHLAVSALQRRQRTARQLGHPRFGAAFRQLRISCGSREERNDWAWDVIEKANPLIAAYLRSLNGDMEKWRHVAKEVQNSQGKANTAARKMREEATKQEAKARQLRAAGRNAEAAEAMEAAKKARERAGFFTEIGLRKADAITWNLESWAGRAEQIPPEIPDILEDETDEVTSPKPVITEDVLSSVDSVNRVT